MSWLYLQALVADCSGPDGSGGDACAPAKSTRTAKRSCSRGKRTVASILSRSGRTFAVSTDDRGVASWMSSLRGSHANRSAPPGNKPEKTTSGTSGRRRSASFATYDRGSVCWRTSQHCLLMNTLEPFSGTWPRAGSTRDGIASRRAPLAPRTGGTGCGLWPTPLAGDAKNTRNSTANRCKMPPTGVHGGDTLVDRVTKFPTPMARDWKSSNAGPGTLRRNSRPLNEVAARGRGGQLNPTWVEWLMGWPIGWTDLKPLATDRFRQWCEQHGSC